MRSDPQPQPGVAGQTPQAQIAPAAPPSTAIGQLDALSYNQLRARLNELQAQRQSLADRRANVAGTYERTTGASKEGIGARLAVMDKSMVQIESDLAAVGQAMVPKAPITGAPTAPSFNTPGGLWRGDDVAGLGFSIFLGTMLITVLVMRRFARRRWGRMQPTAAPGLLQSNERLDRIEQAVDTIAVEIERVSENQRFMTRLMTETQLAGTIAAVRSSAEAAKSAADEMAG